MSEQLQEHVESDDPFEHAKDLTAELEQTQVDPTVDYAAEMPTKPEDDAPSRDKKIYHNNEKWLRTNAAELYPDDVEGAMVMSGLTPYLHQGETLKRPDFRGKEGMAVVRQRTEYQFLLTHFALQRSDDEEYMRQFWQSAMTMGEKAGKNPEEVRKLRSGVLCTVATMKALDALGFNPHLAHPEEDARDAVDVWTSDHNAYQVKSAGQLEVYKTDKVEFPAVRLDEEGKPVKIISTRTSDRFEKDLERFASSVDNISAREGRAVEGLFVTIPYSRINAYTGEPSEELLEELRHKLEHPVVADNESASSLD